MALNPDELRLVALTAEGKLDGAAKADVTDIAKREATAATTTLRAQLPSREDVSTKLDAAVFEAYIQRASLAGGNIPQPGGGQPTTPTISAHDNGNGTATIGGITVPTLTAEKLTGTAVRAVQAIQFANNWNVCSPEFGADPTGAKDSTAAIQAAIDRAATQPYGGAVYIPAGVYKVSYPFIALKGWVEVYGDGLGTKIVATDTVPVAEKTGVFHTGTYNVRIQDKGLFRPGVRDLFIKTSIVDGHHRPCLQNVCGIVLNTDLGDGPADPDAVPRLENLEIWDTDTGIAIFGRDDQGIKAQNIRIRRCLNQGVLVGKPPTHPEYIAKVAGYPGGADNHFNMVEASGCNLAGNGCAGFEIYTSQCHLVNCKSWYNHRFRPWQDIYGLTTPGLTSTGELSGAYVPMGAEATAGATRKRQWMHDGAGFYVKATRTIIDSCQAQENGGHGFMIEWGRNQISNCASESSSWYDALSKAAKPNEAADFYICNDARGTIITGCRSDSPHENEKPHQAGRWGYYIETYIERLRISDCLCDNHAADKIAAIGNTLRDGVKIDIETIFKSTLARHKGVTS